MIGAKKMTLGSFARSIKFEVHERSALNADSDDCLIRSIVAVESVSSFPRAVGISTR